MEIVDLFASISIASPLTRPFSGAAPFVSAEGLGRLDRPQTLRFFTRWRDVPFPRIKVVRESNAIDHLCSVFCFLDVPRVVFFSSALEGRLDFCSLMHRNNFVVRGWISLMGSCLCYWINYWLFMALNCKWSILVERGWTREFFFFKNIFCNFLFKL